VRDEAALRTCRICVSEQCIGEQHADVGVRRKFNQMAAMTARGAGCSAAREWVGEAVLFVVDDRALARALDRDELVAAAAFAGTGVGRDRAGDFFLADLAVGRGLGEFP
jgi:hypothetical protein